MKFMKFQEFRDISGISGDFYGYVEIGRIFCNILDICLFRYQSIQNTDISVDISLYLSILSTLIPTTYTYLHRLINTASSIQVSGQYVSLYICVRFSFMKVVQKMLSLNFNTKQYVLSHVSLISFYFFVIYYSLIYNMLSA